MPPTNKVYIATSLDGFIADKNGGIEWLDLIPNPDHSDMGFNDFISGIDALLMGRNTFDIVCGFDVEWPYSVPVFVLSNSMSSIPDKYQGKAFLVQGDLSKVLEDIHSRGYHNLYIDGGTLIQSFLRLDLIDDLIVSKIPVLLGEGIPLFGSLPKQLEFEHVSTNVLLQHIVQSHYRRKRKA